MTNQKPSKDFSDPNSDEALAQELLKALDDFLSAGDWDATLFLKANKKKLEALRGQVESLLNEVSAKKAGDTQIKREPPPGYKRVYVSLFQAEANNMLKWQSTIKGLEKYSVSRPVYWEEAHVQAWIRNKADPAREGYVIAFVKETDIVKPYQGKVVADRFGHELVTLRERAIELANIVEFVHNEKRYRYSQGELVLMHVNTP